MAGWMGEEGVWWKGMGWVRGGHAGGGGSSGERDEHGSGNGELAAREDCRPVWPMHEGGMASEEHVD